MTWEQKLEAAFGKEFRYANIFHYREGLFRWDSENYHNAETAIINGDLATAEKWLNANRSAFEAYKTAYKLYKKYPGPKTTTKRYIGNISSLEFEDGILKFPVPTGISPETFILRGSRLYAHYKERIAKHPRNQKA